jgi:hypothetical protein
MIGHVLRASSRGGRKKKKKKKPANQTSAVKTIRSKTLSLCVKNPSTHAV